MFLASRFSGRPTVRRRLFVPRLDPLEGRSLPSTLTVSNNLDHGPGSLRAQIAAAGNNDTIDFAASLTGQTIALTSGELVVAKSVDIEGPGAANLTISGSDASRIFHINDKTKVTIAGLTIAHGSAIQGAGIDNAGGKLIVANCVIADNRVAAVAGGDALGGRHLQ